MIVCTLKSGLPDLLLPISSFSSRMLVSTATSSINIVVPNGIIFADDIAARLDGYIELAENGVTFAYSDSMYAIQLSQGAASSSVQITSIGSFPSIPPGLFELTGVSFKTITVNGDIRLRALFNPHISPGSTVTYDGVSHEVDQITVSHRSGGNTMELFANA